MIRSVLMSALVLLSGSVCAQTFHIEEDRAYRPVPEAIAKAVQTAEGSLWDKEIFEHCSLVGAQIDLRANGRKNGYIVSTNGCGGGSAAMPVWLVETTSKAPHVLMSFGAVTVQLTNQRTNGFRNAIAVQSNAGHCEAIDLRFNGKHYIEAKRSKCTP